MSDHKLILGDCLDELPKIFDKNIDLVLTDPPYGTTQCKWDSIISLDFIWKELKRITKENTAIIFTASQPFTTTLINSNIEDFRYDLVWCKNQGTNFYNANRMPLRSHEDILIFYKKLPTYNPQKTDGKPYEQKRGTPSEVYRGKDLHTTKSDGKRFPLSWKIFKKDKEKLHPTQKPVALLEYLIKTYTNENDTVLDFTMGSGSTGVACKNLNRNFIGIEKDNKYFDIAKQRIEGVLI